MVRVTDPAVPNLSARQCDVWRPLLALADAAASHWSVTARTAALALAQLPQEEGDYGLLILSDLRALFQQDGTEALFSARIVQALGQMEHRPWPEYGKREGKPITTRGVAVLLKRFQVEPRTVRIGADTAKGYRLEDLEPVFRTYLPVPPDLSVTTSQMPSDPPSEDQCDAVTDRNGGVRGVEETGVRWAPEKPEHGDAWEPEPGGLP
jgi:hypothetical protein